MDVSGLDGSALGFGLATLTRIDADVAGKLRSRTSGRVSGKCPQRDKQNCREIHRKQSFMTIYIVNRE
jgi:hypothetical protein